MMELLFFGARKRKEIILKHHANDIFCYFVIINKFVVF